MRRSARALLALALAAAVCFTWMAAAPVAKAATSPDWYLAEGSTAWGFTTTIQIANPNVVPLTAEVTYMTAAGPVFRPNVRLAARSQTTLNPLDELGERDFSTRVHCVEGETIAVDRTMTWMGGPGALWAKYLESHSCVGVTAPAIRWYLPEGSADWGFETWLLIQNPNGQPADCRITYMLEQGEPVVRNETIPPSARRTFSMADAIGAEDASILVECNLPVIPERAMYRNERRLGTDSIGTTTAASDFYLAEGTTAWGFTTYLLIQNPNDVPSTVKVEYMTPSGPREMPSFTMARNSRRTIRVNDQLKDSDCSIHVSGSAPIIAERSMYWGSDTGFGEAAHDSIGVQEPHTSWLLPDGDCTDLMETWTLVQNPNPVAVSVQVSYLPVATGTHLPTAFTEVIPANSRRTYDMSKGSDGPARYSTVVSSLDAGQGIIVERSMYIDTEAGQTYRTGGSDTIGAWIP